MENQPEASNMIMMFERMLQEQRSTKMGQWLASEKKEGFGTDSETEIRFGRPSTEGVASDCGSGRTDSDKDRGFFAKHGVWLTLITTYNPEANGKIERGHSTIIKALAKACN